ncbi:M48 family metallopeptidase, partial [Nitrososphaera sp. AFS]|uniref:M48 family metallopeptidase n=1 Tax=Nitrososphaera sp. AFS TaxID=2301191 RepID=UPI0013922D1D
MIPSPKLQLHYGTKTIEYSIIKSKRIKTSEIIVDANSVVVRTPFHKTTSEVHDIIKKKVDWILKKQLEYKVNNSQIIKPTFQHGSTLPYLGKNYPLHIISNQETDEKINFVNGEFLVHINKFKYSKKRIKLLYEEWLVNVAIPFIERRMELYSKELGVTPQKFKLKMLRSRWGSITIDGAIHLSIDLLKAPYDIIDYMILHELCHL